MQPLSTSNDAVTPDALATDLLALLRGVARTGSGRFLEAIESHGLSMTALKLLLILGDSDEEVSSSRLARLLGLSPAATSRAADDAVRRGHVPRRECEDDRRMKLLALSPAGREVADELAAARFEGVREFADSLSAAERAKATDALQALIALLPHDHKESA